VPSEITPLVAPQQTVSKLALSTKTSVNAANQEYDRITDPNTSTPSAPVHAARLNGLLKTLANAEGAVAESIKARKILIEGLEKILNNNRSALAADESSLVEISGRRDAIEAKKRDVEDSIMRGFATNSPVTPANEGTPGQNDASTTPTGEPDAPEFEALTPPAYEAISPQSPPQNQLSFEEAVPAQQSTAPATAGSDLLASLSGSYQGSRQESNGSIKKRKLNDDFPELGGDAMDGIDDDVMAMLQSETKP
jgi:regulator of Ty1 transposition protein 103